MNAPAHIAIKAIIVATLTMGATTSKMTNSLNRKQSFGSF